jgi:hypothetical protein
MVLVLAVLVLVHAVSGRVECSELQHLKGGHPEGAMPA